MKKISRRAFLKVSGIGAAVLGAAALTACGGTSSAAGSSAAGSTSAAAGSAAAQVSGDITFLTNRTDLDGDGTYESLIARFNEKYPDVTVEVESITDYAGELATRMQTAEYGDVLMIPDAVPKSAYAKYFVPFGTADELKDKYQEAYLYSKWYDGQVYGLAYMCTVQGIVYNKAVFEKAGITALPGTVDEFLTDLQTIKDKTDAIPYYTNTNSGWTLDQWEDHCYGSITGDADYKNNKLPHDKTAFDEGASHYTVARLLYDIVDKKLCEDDPTTCDWESSKGMLNNGEIGCMILGNWAVQQMKDAGDHPEDVGYMPFPYTVDGKQYATSGTDYCYGINVNSKNQDAAKAFVTFMVDESGLALSSGGISLLNSDPLPDGLENFSSVTFVVDKPASSENEGLYDKVQQDSGITLYDNGARLGGVVDIARGASTDTFESYMANLSSKWAAAVQ